MPRRLLQAVALALSACEGTVGSVPGLTTTPSGLRIAESGVRRLTAFEYDNALVSLLSDTTRSGAALLPPDYGDPFDHDYTRQQASEQLVNAAETLAQTAVTKALADPSRRGALVPCTPRGRDDAACLAEFVEKFGLRALRRPLSPSEVQSYVTAFLPFATESNPALNNDFYTAVSLAAQAMLQDPEFLYRIETGTSVDQATGIRALSNYEIATRLSFFLWGTIPDSALLLEAQKGVLTSAAHRREVATNMLSDLRARQQVQRFHAFWLGYKSIAHSPALTAAFDAETAALINKVVFDQKGSYARLFTSTETFIGPTLGQHYSIPGAGASPSWVTYPPGSKRAGILSHGAVLSAFSKFSDTSPTQRGIFVRTRLLCQTIGSPPANVNADNPPPAVQGSNCKTDRYAAHRNVPSCAACHNQLDPIGFGLENFDRAGVWREHDDDQSSCALDGRGSVYGLGDFSGPAELGRLLVDSGRVQACASRQLFRFAHGRKEVDDDDPAVKWLAEQFAQSDFAFDQLLLTLVGDEGFAFKKDEPSP